MSITLPFSGSDLIRRLSKTDLIVHEAARSGDTITVTVTADYIIENGSELKFKAPIACTEVTRLLIQYTNNGETITKKFAFADANGNDLGDLNNLFAQDAIVKVILGDINTGTPKAFIQNADTNKYLEDQFESIREAIKPDETLLVNGKAADAKVVGDLLKAVNKSIAEKCQVQIITWAEGDELAL